MEQWRQCGRWLIDCKVLPPNHRVVWPSAVVFDLAQALRDGVLLCQLLHNLSPGSIDMKDINFRPQMSQVTVGARARGRGGRRRGRPPGSGGNAGAPGRRGGGRTEGRAPGLGAGSHEGRPREAEVDRSPSSRGSASAARGLCPGNGGLQPGRGLHCRVPRSRATGPASVPSDPGESAAPGASAGVPWSGFVRCRTPGRPSRRDGGRGGAEGQAERGASGRRAQGVGGPAAPPPRQPRLPPDHGGPSRIGPQDHAT